MNRKFNVGDVVKVVTNEDYLPELNGRVGKITRIHDFVPYYGELAIVELDNREVCKMATDFLELVAPETEEIPEEKSITKEDFLDAIATVFGVVSVWLADKIFDEYEND